MGKEFSRREILFLLGGVGFVATAGAIGLNKIPKNVNANTLSTSQTPIAVTEMVDIPKEEKINLLKNGSWEKMPGATIEEEGIVVSHVGMGIVNQDGTPGVLNPVINLFGPRLKVSGDFEVSTSIKDINQSATFYMYGVPPVIYDEFRVDHETLKITIEDTSLQVSAWESDKEPKRQNKFNINAENSLNLDIKRQGELIVFSVNENIVGSLPLGQLFSKGDVWFGFESEDANGSFFIDTLEARGVNGGNVFIDEQTLISQKDQNGFQSLIKNKIQGFSVGAAVSPGPLLSDKSYFDLSTGWYGSWTTENVLKPQFVQPIQGVFTFGEADGLIEVAQKNGITVHGHTLVFGEANPLWMTKSLLSEREEIMKSHIKAVLERYKGVVSSWDVVNEPLADDFFDGPLTLRNHIWHQAMGADYISKALTQAHEVDPDALLFINEWGLEADGDRWMGMLSLVDSLKAQGVPIDGIGFQAHVYEPGDEIDPEVLRRHFRQLAKRGLKARVSEMDVYGRGSLLQSEQFASVLNVCIEEPNCIGFTTWGIGEKYGSTSWLDEKGILQIGDGLPFNVNLEPLPPVFAMQSVLRDY